MASSRSPTLTELQRLLNDASCPKCQDNDKSVMNTTDLGSGSFIRTCSTCFWSTGVDDSVNLCDLGGDEYWEFEPKEPVCLGKTNHYPVYIGSDKSGLMLSRCAICRREGIMFSNGKDGDETALHKVVYEAIVKTIEENASREDLERIISDLQEDPFMSVEELESSLHENELVCVCDCGNGNPEIFEQILDSSGKLAQLKCLQCDAEFSAGLDADLNSYLSCDRCDNNIEDCFQLIRDTAGKLIQIKCLNCDVVAPFSGCHKETLENIKSKTFENTEYIHREHVTSWDMIERGNHISWQRDFAYEHHAIVISINKDQKILQVIEYGSNSARIVSVQERDETIENMHGIDLYRYDYDPENCFAPDEVVERAKSKLGERKYNLFTKNCEHFATWCKTGKEYCTQIKPFLRRAGQTIISFINQLSKPVIDLIQSKVFVAIASGLSPDDVLDLAARTLRRLNIDKAFFIGGVVFTVLLNLIVELAMFYASYSQIKKEFECGKISKSEKRKKLFELCGEHIGGLLLGLLLGFSWILLGAGIFGLIVSIVLNIVGIIAGRFLGAWLGRKLHKFMGKKLTE